jgi:cytochrome c biogenesis protein CcdA
MTLATLALAFLAGVLSILSPCVLPLVPIVLAGAAAEHRLGPLALAAGLAISFSAIGLFVAIAGFSMGLDAEWFRRFGAALLAAIGLVLLAPVLQIRLAAAGGPMSNWIEGRLGRFSTAGPGGQLGLGLLLGSVWVPCVGPTLGAASVLAAQGRDLGQVALTMTLFGLGAALPLAGLGLASREAVGRWRSRLLGSGSLGKKLLGALLLATGLSILLGLDRVIETALVDASPDWLTELTTRY